MNSPKKQDIMPYRFAKFSGFTMVEMVVVIAIIGILVMTLVGVAGNVGKKNSERGTVNVLSVMDSIIRDYYDARGKYPLHAIDCSDENYVGEDKNAYLTGSTQADRDARLEVAKRNSTFLIKQLRTVSACSKALDSLSSKNLIKATDAFEVFDEQYDAVKYDGIKNAVRDRYDFASNDGYEYLLDSFGNPINYQLVRKRDSSDKWIGKGRPVVISAGRDGWFGTFREDKATAKDDLRSDQN